MSDNHVNLQAGAGSAEPMVVYEAMAELLRGLGLDTVFGLMGDANMMMVTAYRDGGGRYIRSVHEAGAVTMADGYHRATGRIGVATITHGPGMTNATTAITEAARARSQVLVISGATPAEPTNPQRLDLAAVAHAAGAIYERVHRPETVGRDLTRALQKMRTARLPVILDVPIDLSRESVREPQRAHLPHAAAPAVPDPEAVDAAADVIRAARHVLVIAGRGAVTAGAGNEIHAFAERIGAVVGTTIAAKELFRGSDRSMGIVGGLSHDAGARILAETDCIVAFGAALNNWTTFDRTLTPGKRIVQIDHDADAIDAYVPVEQAIVADVRTAAMALADRFEDGARTPWAEVAEQPAPIAPAATREGTVDIRVLAAALDARLPEDIAFVSDVGRFNVGTWPYLHASAPEAFLTMNYFASIGLGLAGAAGVTIARDRRPTLLAVGDGGLMMGIGELATIARESLPVIVAAWNDDAYGFEHFRLVRYGIDPGYSDNDFVERAQIARAFGIESWVIRSVQDLDEAAVLWRDGLDGPVFLDIRIDPFHNLIHW